MGRPVFEQRFEMGLGRLLKAKGGLAAVASVGMAAGSKLDLAIHTHSSSWRSCTFLRGTIIMR